MRLRSEYDREILRLALPALGALAAEPLYLLADTAMVGHLGTPELAALAIAGTLIAGAFTLFNFLTYGTTAQVARLQGAGRDEAAGRLAAQALWLSAGIGVCLTALLAGLAEPLVRLMGGQGHTGDLAVTYLRIGSLGLPSALIALAGQGWLRGMSDMRTPLVIVVVANVANVLLNLLFIYGFGWGLAGSAWATVVAQTGMGAAFAVRLLRAPARSRRPSLVEMRPLGRIGGEIFVRTAALYGSFLVAGAVLARIGEDSLGAHQIAFQLFVFLALVLDSVAIAGQVIVGRALGAGDADGARRAARRMIEWAVTAGALFGLVMLALIDVIPRAFTGDPDVVDRANEIWPLFAVMQPANGAVFALDGILIGAGDTRFLMWGMLAAAFCAFIPITLASLALDWGIVGVWVGLVSLIAVRLFTCAARFRGGRWAVTGAVRAGGAPA
ncbi:MAG TPA: MATE family efflux transporter [Thermoleophilaceae bacterium]|nr:MATE family efflux transporter [Thermoleophilaceae bacterium]